MARLDALSLARIAVLVVSGAFAGAAAGEAIEVGRFSAAGAGESMPAGWEPLAFPKVPRHTKYSLVTDDGTTVVKAVSEGSASGLLRRVRIDPREFPVVAWRWKVSNVLRNADPRRREGDDYPARLYITFVYDPAKLSFVERMKYRAARAYYGEYPPTGAINYVWDSRTPVGTSLPNAYTDRTRMIVVESGAAKVGRWVAERRNVYDDFKEAFGEEPPEISGVAVMTDTDNTGESATAFYGDIVFEKGESAGNERPSPPSGN